MSLLPYPTPPRDQCWPWGGAHRKQDGRPVYRRMYAYRYVYELFIGTIPKGKPALHHLCDEKWCVNPWHLQPVTQREHARIHDSLAGMNASARRTACPRGHAYDRIYKSGPNVGNRYCGKCHDGYKRGRKAWLRENGHSLQCTRARCTAECAAAGPVGHYRHDYGSEAAA